MFLRLANKNINEDQIVLITRSDRSIEIVTSHTGVRLNYDQTTDEGQALSWYEGLTGDEIAKASGEGRTLDLVAAWKKATVTKTTAATPVKATTPAAAATPVAAATPAADPAKS